MADLLGCVHECMNLHRLALTRAALTCLPTRRRTLRVAVFG